MKTTPEAAFETSLSAEQIAIRDDIVEKTRQILSLQRAGRIREAQDAYKYLQGWCDGKGVDFGNAYEGAIRRLRRTACGLLDSQVTFGLMHEPDSTPS